jgi:hypothetical protein
VLENLAVICRGANPFRDFEQLEYNTPGLVQQSANSAHAELAPN